MRKLFFKGWAKLTGRNSIYTPVDVIRDQMLEPRPLPMGRKEFDDWSDRIIGGTLLSGGNEDPKIFIEGQKYALAHMLLHLGPTESHKPDAFFIHSLRKFAVNQVADTVSRELHAAAKARLAAKEAAAKEAADKDRMVVNEDEQGRVQATSADVVHHIN